MTHPHLIADELRALALLGLTYVRDPYDLDRYRRVLMLSAALAAQDSPARLGEVRGAYLQNLAHVSPLLGVDVLVMRDDRLLLIRRSDSGLWATPGGLADVGETPASAAERELFEEAGLRGRAARLLGLVDARHAGFRHGLHIVTALFLVEAEGDPHPTLEAPEVGWFPWDALPELHPGHAATLRIARGALDSGTPYFDPGPVRKWHAQGHPGSTTHSPRPSLHVRLVRLLMRASLRTLLRG